MNRRAFMGNIGALSATSKLKFLSAHAVNKTLPPILSDRARGIRFSEVEVDIPDHGWKLWLDRNATWKDDEIFLPEDVVLAKLPVNKPTNGWRQLSEANSLSVTLPTTVEQFFWGKTGFRPYHDEYKFEATDDEVKNGAYYGVSWWWRPIHIPASFSGKRILLHIRGARQRAEVYFNKKLVGYSILEELPFECDLTSAAKPDGENLLAIRITNPGGRLDWRDKSILIWGGLEIQKSHGFGGIDRGMVISAQDPVRIADTWALNTSEIRQINAYAKVENTTEGANEGKLLFSVLSPRSRKVLATREVPATVPTGQETTYKVTLEVPQAELWDLDKPNVYRLRAEWIPKQKAERSIREVDFGFRWITVDGLGKDAVFRLNGRRIRIYTSISWGYWALNGLFPTPELAEKEVRVAKEFNLNTLNFHRNLGKEDVLYVQDRMGLMRCLEPGGGSQAFESIKGKESIRRYMLAKIQGMVRAFRSHPSVIHYIIQNEASFNPDSPEVAEVFKMMQQEDPSRTIVGNDGFVMRTLQAWAEPYKSDLHKSDQKATLKGGAGGWWVDHSGHFSDVWQDSYYQGPDSFYYHSSNRKEIVEWGEMKGAASIDNHASVLRQIARHGGHSYDLVDHQEILHAYEAFLDRWSFRNAFPTTESLFLSIGRRAYESWGQFMENVRICDENDMAAISGWESTAMENHSGLVDNFRDFKSDPRPIRQSLLPIRPVAKQRALVLQTGDRALFDAYLLNDSNSEVRGKLRFKLLGPAGSSEALAEYDPPKYERDRLSYPLQMGVETPPLNRSGRWHTSFALEGHPESTHRCDLLVVDPVPASMRALRVGVSELAPAIEAALHRIPLIKVEPFSPGSHYDVIIGSGGNPEASHNLAVDAEGAYKPGDKPLVEATLREEVIAAVRKGIPLLAMTPTDGQSIGVAKQLAEMGSFKFRGMVGTSRASWMGSWYFIRKHPLYDGMPVDQAMSIHYQVKGGGANGWLVDGPGVEIVVAYSRDHDRNIGAGTFTVKSDSMHMVLHRVTDMHPVLLQRFLANALLYLAGKA